MRWTSSTRSRSDRFIDAGGKDIPLSHFDLAFKNVDFGYDSRQVLKNVSFTIPEKTSAAIVGPSGSGKTTICSLIARFYDPQSGAITLGGHDLKEFTCDSLLSNISMVFQNVYLFHDTIRANILFGKPGATEAEMIDAAKKARCYDFIMALPDGFDTVTGEGGGTLSGGEKQRISIARAELRPSEAEAFLTFRHMSVSCRSKPRRNFSAAGEDLLPFLHGSVHRPPKDMDEYIRRLDEKNAELEAAEVAEREAQQKPWSFELTGYHKSKAELAQAIRREAGTTVKKAREILQSLPHTFRFESREEMRSAMQKLLEAGRRDCASDRRGR